MPIYARNRPTKAQVDARNHNRRTIDEVRQHNEDRAAEAQQHLKTVVDESMKDSAIRKRLQAQLDGVAPRHSDDDAVDSFERSVGRDNLRLRQ